ncbi:hypothetical protein K461DRAFT_265052 [Myriangium duriaei CBS 260.36]|uniref:F-box domain-containing protein n=1 Tax=Myriangium duriaei CBS 260.36 TaxID=1168546 RepID=A0A9P4J7G2_9PEZI|nr:hypothetical protein K461DRAFT_265052 [Myriangium duriaei CBS 260.36]
MVRTRAASKRVRCETPSDKDNRLLRLPREIRDQIYKLVLVSQSSILVYKSGIIDDKDGSAANHWAEIPHATALSLRHVNVNLLLTCRTLASEASFIFYNRNTFAFRGDRGWEKSIAWLYAIGANRSQLTSLEIDMRKPSHAWQFYDGTMEGLEDGYIDFDTAPPRHPLLQRPKKGWAKFPRGCWQEGEIEAIDPKLEDLFSVLGHAANAPSISIELRSIGEGFPGLPVSDEAEDGDEHYSMDLPNLVEAWRCAHGADTDPSQPAGSWVGDCASGLRRRCGR